MTRRPTIVTLVLALAVSLVATLIPTPPAGAAAPTEAVRISVSATGAQGTGGSLAAVANADGTWIAFQSGANDLVPNDTQVFSPDVFVRNVTAGTTRLVTSQPDGSSVIGGGSDPSISDDGTRVVFTSQSPFYVPAGDTANSEDVFLRDLTANTVTRVSRPVAGGATDPSGDSRNAQISGDGTKVVFSSTATNITFSDSHPGEDVYLFDVASGANTLLSPGNGSPLGSTDPSISDNGSVIAFASANPSVVPGDTNGKTDVFVRAPGVAVRRIQRNAADPPNGNSFRPDVSGDGNVLVFHSEASDMVLSDTNAKTDVFGIVLSGGPPQRVSVSAAGVQANGDSVDATVSENGALVAFSSVATNLAPNDTNNTRDIFVRDALAGTMSFVNVQNATTQASPGESVRPDLPDTGPFVFYSSTAKNLVNGDTNNLVDVFRSSALRCDGRRVTVDLNAGGGTTAGVDIVRGTFGADAVSLGAGNDRACMGPGNDNVNAEAGNDRVFGGLGLDTLSGSIDNDALFGEAGNDSLNGGPGADTCDGGQGATDTAINCETKVNVP